MWLLCRLGASRTRFVPQPSDVSTRRSAPMFDSKCTPRSAATLPVRYTLVSPWSSMIRRHLSRARCVRIVFYLSPNSAFPPQSGRCC